jgi:RNA polymerase sigma factor (sigma-70 family)
MPAPDLPANPLRDLAELGAAFERYRPRLEAVVRNRLPAQIADPTDVLHEAFLVAAQRWEANRPVSRDDEDASQKMRVWLHGLVLDQVIRFYRRSQTKGRDHRRAMPWPENTTLQVGLRLAGGATPSAEAVGKELRAGIRLAIDHLSDLDREVVLMHDFEGLTFKEIGGLLGHDQNTINVRHLRAVRRLRAALSQYVTEGAP